MRNLWRADFYRLRRDKLFHLLLALMALLGAALPVIHALDRLKNQVVWTPDDSCLTFVFAVPVLSALLTALFVGSEYSDGTLRNRLIVGHRRSHIYLANAAVCGAASVMLSAAYIVPHTILGLLLLGGFETAWSSLLIYTGLSLTAGLAFTACFVLIAMLCRSKAYTAAACLLLTFALLFSGIHIVSALNEPEYYSAYSYTENGETVSEDQTKNPNHLSGVKRDIYAFLYDFDPGGQVIQLANMKAEHSARLALYDGLILMLTVGCGMLVFRRKDLK